MVVEMVEKWANGGDSYENNPHLFTLLSTYAGVVFQHDDRFSTDGGKRNQQANVNNRKVELGERNCVEKWVKKGGGFNSKGDVERNKHRNQPRINTWC